MRVVVLAFRAEATASGVGSWDDGSTALRDLFRNGHVVRVNVKAARADFFSSPEVPGPFVISSEYK